jgi:hypothetical protein
MKKVLVAAVIGTAMMLGSCGLSTCDCVQAQKDMAKEMEEAGDNLLDKGLTEAKFASKMEECKKMGEENAKALEGLDEAGKTAKMKEWAAEAEKC